MARKTRQPTPSEIVPGAIVGYGNSSKVIFIVLEGTREFDDVEVRKVMRIDETQVEVCWRDLDLLHSKNFHLYYLPAAESAKYFQKEGKINETNTRN